MTPGGAGILQDVTSQVMGKGFEGREVTEQRGNIPKQSFFCL